MFYISFFRKIIKIKNVKIKFLIYCLVSAAIIWILISVFSKETGVHIILPVIAVIYLTGVHWFIDISSCSEIWRILLCLLCSAGLGLISGIIAFKLWTYKERWMARKSSEYLPQSKLNLWNLIGFLGITLPIVFYIQFSISCFILPFLER